MGGGGGGGHELVDGRPTPSPRDTPGPLQQRVLREGGGGDGTRGRDEVTGAAEGTGKALHSDLECVAQGLEHLQANDGLCLLLGALGLHNNNNNNNQSYNMGSRDTRK